MVLRVAAERSPGAALEIGESAARYTEADSLLEALVAIADAAGNPGQAAHWRDTRVTVSKARASRSY